MSISWATLSRPWNDQGGFTIMETLKEVEVHTVEPENFTPQVEIAAAYVEVENKILFLQRSGLEKYEKGLWGVPAGKIEQGESAESAVKRELLEETGISIDSHSRFDPLGQLFIRKPSVDYTYHLYRLSLSKKPTVSLSDEHQDSHWAVPNEIENLPLMLGALEAFWYYKAKSDNKVRSGTNVNAYLILKKEKQILLHLRKNTGYYDGYYGLVSGHIEDGESAKEGLVREAKEEAGISIDALHLHFVHCLHRQTNRLNIDLFFECDHWKGEIMNREPEKCTVLQFFPIHDLPSNMVGYVAQVVECATREKYYSEQGWQGQK